MESAFILDQDAEVGRLRDLLAKAVATVESELVKQHYPHAMDALSQQLVKLGAAGVDNVSTASEGFVFSVDGKVYKFTGNFAPVNQILGMLKYGRGSVAPIERLVQTVDNIEAGNLEIQLTITYCNKIELERINLICVFIKSKIEID